MASNNPSNELLPMDVSDRRRLQRFLAFGTETGPYRPSAMTSPLSPKEAPTISNLISVEKGDEVVQEIQKFHEEKLSASDDAILFALALCARDSDLKTKSAAYDKAFLKICQNPLQLFTFVKYASTISKATTGCGWGKAHRKAVASYYNSMPAKELLLAVCRYVNRDSWSHKDLIKLSHVKATNDAVAVVLYYVMMGYYETIKHYETATSDDVRAVIELIKVINTVKHSTDEQQVARLVEENNLSLEFVPTKLQKSKEVWRAAVRAMPLRELLCHLSRIGSVGLFEGDNPALDLVQCRITDSALIKEEKIHPLEILIAWQNYERNKYRRQWARRKPEVTSVTSPVAGGSRLRYQPNTDVVNSLKKAYYTSFKHLATARKRCLVAIDVRETAERTMGAPFVTPLVAAAGLVMTIVRTERETTTLVYEQGLSAVKVTGDMDLDTVCRIIKRANTGATDCSSPLFWATGKSLKFDVILVITDKPSCPATEPSVVLKRYRQVVNLPNSRMMTSFLTCNRTTVATVGDQNMLDLIGLDAGTSRILHNFIQGLL